MLTGERAPAPPAIESAELWDAVRALPVRQRTAVALRHVCDLSREEIAAVMNGAAGTVSATLTAARRRLDAERRSRSATRPRSSSAAGRRWPASPPGSPTDGPSTVPWVATGEPSSSPTAGVVGVSGFDAQGLGVPEWVVR